MNNSPGFLFAFGAGLLAFLAGFSVVFLALRALAESAAVVLTTYGTSMRIVSGLMVLVLCLFTLGVLRVRVLYLERRVHMQTKSLSGKWWGRGDGSKFAPDNEASSELNEGEVEVLSLLPAGLQTAEPVEPGVADLHGPTPREMAFGMSGWGKGLSLTGLFRDMGGEVVLPDSATTRGRAVRPGPGRRVHGRSGNAERTGRRLLPDLST